MAPRLQNEQQLGHLIKQLDLLVSKLDEVVAAIQLLPQAPPRKV